MRRTHHEEDGPEELHPERDIYSFSLGFVKLPAPVTNSFRHLSKLLGGRVMNILGLG